MYITTIETSNFLPFRGSHRIDLEPLAYGVTARRLKDYASSNWVGKTSLLTSIRFALYGSHTAQSEDGWITRDECEGSVSMALSDGIHITRSRSRSQPTRLEVTPPNAPKLVGVEAQSFIERWIGLSERDFLATSFFEQKRMSRFVTARPAQRFADVAEWVQLGPLREAEVDTRSKLNALVERETKAVASVELLRSRIGERTIEQLNNGLTIATIKAKQSQDEVVRLEARTDLQSKRIRLEVHAREYDKAESELKSLIPLVQTTLPKRVQTDVELKSIEYRDARSKTHQARVLVKGEFDGYCPVAPILCPAKTAINARTEENAKALQDAQKLESIARTIYENTRAIEERAITAERERAQLETRIGLLKSKIKELAQPHIELARLGSVEDVSELLRTARSIANEANRLVSNANAELRNAERDIAELVKIEAALSAIRIETQTLREAVAILGRNGAQRRLARGAVIAIELGANERLSRAGIALSVRLTWGRETNDLALNCDACGEPFSPGRSVKVCRCGADRGAKIIDELGCELSNVSGAAEDLVGVALSLSAASWLRSDRLSGWGVALIDEPFGSLDTANREALARALGSMLSSSDGWEQALVVAHHESAMEALPGRVQIVAGPYGSWPRVIG